MRTAALARLVLLSTTLATLTGASSGGADGDPGRRRVGPAAVGPEPSAVPLGPVRTHRPAVRVEDVGADATAAVSRLDGVATATVVRIGRIPLRTGARRLRVTVAAVDPAGLRRLAPQITADSATLWERIARGEAAFTHEQGERLGLELGGYVRLGDRRARTRVGAFATHTLPPLADAVIHDRRAAQLGLAAAPRTLLVGVDPGTDPTTVAAAVGRRLSRTATVVPDPRRPHGPDPEGGGGGVWDRLAQCESGGRWHLNSGNGFYGGLQFLPESWRLVGGTGLPHRASRREQIRRAERLQARQGWAAWPVCSIRLGLRPRPGG